MVTSPKFGQGIDQDLGEVMGRLELEFLKIAGAIRDSVTTDIEHLTGQAVEAKVDERRCNAGLRSPILKRFLSIQG